MNKINLKPAYTVAKLASARQHQQNGRPSWSARSRVDKQQPTHESCRTLKHRFGHDLQRRIGNCEDDALRLCSIAFGSGLKSPSVRPRVGRVFRAAWGGVRAGDYI